MRPRPTIGSGVAGFGASESGTSAGINPNADKPPATMNVQVKPMVSASTPPMSGPMKSETRNDPPIMDIERPRATASMRRVM